jgi:LysM repeat protein
MANGSLFYTVKSGDTLGKVAQQNGTTVTELCKINSIKDPNRIDVGQKIALKAEAVCGVACQLLDRDWNPIPHARMLFEYSGKKVERSSGTNGYISDLLTESPDDMVKIFIARADGSWKKITEVCSSLGNKLVTLVSPKLRIEAETLPHPKDKSGRPVPDTKDPNRKPISPPEHPKDAQGRGKLQGGEFGDGKGTKTEDAKTKDGAPVKKVTKDQAALDFLGGYTGEKITEEDYEKAAKELGCEVEVIKAIAMQETEKLKRFGLGSFDKHNRPTIMYERHYFSEKTQNKYDKINPDLSSPKAYIGGHARRKEIVEYVTKKGGKIKKTKFVPYDDGKHYGLYSWQYTKLAKAYALDKDAAIRACSWGMFQVMGDNYAACGFKTPHDFAKAMSKSEREHLKAFVAYCKYNKLEKALKEKDWKKIAQGYNGPQYYKNKYDEKIRVEYEKLIKHKK